MIRGFLRRNWRSIFILLAMLFDAAAFALAAIAAFFLRDLIPNVPQLPAQVFVDLTLFAGTVSLVMAMVLGVYRSSYHSNPRQQYFLAGKAYLYSVFIVLASFYILQKTDFPRRFTLILFLTLPLYFLLMRAMLNRLNVWLQRKGFGSHNTLIVEYGESYLDVFERFERFPELGYTLKGVVSKRRNGQFVTLPNGHGTLPLYELSEVSKVVRKESIDRIFVPSPKFITNGYSELIEVCRRSRIKLKVLSPEADQLLRMVKIYDIAGISLYSPSRRRIEWMKRAAKRIFDAIGSLILLVILSPVFLTTAIAIFMESGRPILFKQKRSATKGGKSFYFYKFRSMVRNADEMKESLFRHNESDGALFKLKKDPRMTKVGRLIRKFSIDELPQLLNVLRGDMSLVGPRPLPVADFDKVKEGADFWAAIKDREKLKPGMTGIWQISGRSNIGFKEMVLLDLYYVENQSLLFDLEILFGTIPVVLFGKGAY